MIDILSAVFLHPPYMQTPTGAHARMSAIVHRSVRACAYTIFAVYSRVVAKTLHTLPFFYRHTPPIQRDRRISDGAQFIVTVPHGTHCTLTSPATVKDQVWTDLYSPLHHASASVS